ncbi:hypothetical protein FGO68_gene15301 [Halteria grandinella]|uniref:SKP1 component dimerisation domain-containing protein n=1 Tax=Halteria grandinella TaxID=5974 RepID=A0A8J8NLE2_HALGN|nr:hypothetical protein FGO68_gene15301 [Halteria grandinella]
MFTSQILSNPLNQPQRTVTVLTRDMRTITLDRKIAFRANLIKQMLEDRQEGQTAAFTQANDEVKLCHDTALDDEPVPIPQFDESTVQRVFEFIQHEVNIEKLPEIPKPVPTEHLSDWIPSWFATFININPLEDLMDLIACANYLDVPSLVELGCAKVGCLMKHKSIPELRGMFGIVNDFAPEEELAIVEGRADIWGSAADEEGEPNCEGAGEVEASFGQTPQIVVNDEQEGRGAEEEQRLIGGEGQEQEHQE